MVFRPEMIPNLSSKEIDMGRKDRVKSKIIDAELLQEQQRAPYTFRGMTIREVPINEYPCTEDRCEGYRWSNCPGESWACPEYQMFRSG